jgi:hypothetical protein
MLSSIGTMEMKKQTRWLIIAMMALGCLAWVGLGEKSAAEKP